MKKKLISEFIIELCRKHITKEQLLTELNKYYNPECWQNPLNDLLKKPVLQEYKLQQTPMIGVSYLPNKTPLNRFNPSIYNNKEMI